jgi:hypothetical protein
LNRLDAIALLKEIRAKFNIDMTNFVSLDMDKSTLWKVVLNWTPDQSEKVELQVLAKEHNIKVETKNGFTTFSNLE